MRIMIWTKRRTLLDRLISFFTHGKGYHAGFLRADNKTIHEAFMPKLRDRPLTKEDIECAEIYNLEGMTEELHAAFERQFNYNLTQNIQYSILDLFRYLFNLPSKDEQHTYCSRYVLHCCFVLLTTDLIPLVRLPCVDWGSPRDLRISPKFHPISFEEKLEILQAAGLPCKITPLH